MSKLVENYLLQETVGKGVYGQVFRAIHQKSKGTFAVKVIPKSSFRSNPKLQQLAINEINILSSIKHENIVRFVETLKTPNNFYFVYEFCNGGTLQSQLKKKKYFKQSEALIYFKQLLEAFKELNKNSIMHRDLKPDNIFLSDDIIKLGDFGFCKMLEVNMAQTMLGSPIYMAPQILKEQIYTSKADIWSLGVVLFQMLFGYCPFQSSSISQLINKLKQTEVSIPHEINKISEETEILIRKMLVKDQFKRIEWADLFAFVIDDKGKIVSGCKKQFAIENLERCFFNETGNVGSMTNITSAVSQQGSGSSSNYDNKYASIKQIQSADKNNSHHYNTKSDDNYPHTTGFISYEDKHKSSDRYAYNGSGSDTHSLDSGSNMMKKMNSIESKQQGSLEKLSLKHKPQSLPPDFQSRKKQQKQRFGEVHAKWFEAVKLVQDLALNSFDPNSVEICIYILLNKLLIRLDQESENYPEWTDVLIEEKMSLKEALDDLQKSNKDLLNILDNEKENRGEDRQKKELKKIWENARNKFTLERAIRTAFDQQSKDMSVQEILT